MLGLFGRGRYERAGFQLYTAAVTAARTPYFYAELGVPDTLDGRFDLVGLYACMVIRRLRLLPPQGPRLAQAVFDAMFSDMDINLRELGVGDMTIAKRVRAMWEAFHGRAVAYEAPLAAAMPPHWPRHWCATSGVARQRRAPPPWRGSRWRKCRPWTGWPRPIYWRAG